MGKKNEKPPIGLKQLRAEREKIVEKWSKLGLLEGLEAGIPENLAELLAPNPIQKINEDPSQIIDD